VALKGIEERPEGLDCRLEFVTPFEELELIDFAAGLDLHPVVLHDQASRRLVRHFGGRRSNSARPTSSAVLRAPPGSTTSHPPKATATRSPSARCEPETDTRVTFK
jgi:hypothetical protein